MGKEPYIPHPNLSDGINNALAEQELLGGVWLMPPQGESVKGEPYLATGKTLHVQTQNTLYIIEKRGDDEFYISGHKKYCPIPVKCHIFGCNYGGSMLRMNYVGRGMYMEFAIDIPDDKRKRGEIDGHGTIVTSKIQEITEV
jgi:hypothetical protein